MSTLSAVLSALGLAPKTLPQAKETIDGAKATLDSVAALFTAAGLNLEQMLAAGPDALKAHLESLDDSEALAEAVLENDRLSTELETAKASTLALNSQLSALNFVASEVGLKVEAATKPEDIKTAFAAHIAKATTLALAKTGHPPAHVPAATSPVDDITPKSDPDKAALVAFDQYLALIEADNKAGTKETAAARTDFYAKNHAAISRGMAIRKRS